METSIFVMVFIGFLARGMIGSLINNILKKDLMLFCKPVNIIGAAYFTWALFFSEVTPLAVGFVMSDIILVALMLTGTTKK